MRDLTFTMDWQIDCPPTIAFDLFADVRNETRWNDDVSAAEMLTEEPVGHGSRFLTTHPWPLGQMESTITAFERPRLLEVRTTAKGMDVAISLSFAEEGSGTAVHGRFTPMPRGVMKLLLPLLLSKIQRDMTEQHQNFTQLCEAEARRPT